MTQRIRCIILLLAALVAVVGCTSGGPSEADEATPTPIPTPIVPTKPTYEVQRGEVVKTIQFTGRIAPVVEEQLFFRASGFIGVVNVKRNDWVEEGDILAELEVTDLKDQLAQAEAALASTQSEYDQRVTEATIALKVAELRLAQNEVRSPDSTAAEIALRWAIQEEADAAYEVEKAMNRPWQWQYDQVQRSYNDMWQRAKDDLTVARAEYEAVATEHQIHNMEVEILTTEVELAGIRLERIEAGLDIKEMELTLERLSNQLRDARLLAPFDGQVLSLSVSEGRSVEGYRPVAIIADPSELEVTADIRDRDLSLLAEGMPVSAVLVSSPAEELDGEIRQLPYPYGGGGRSEGVEGQQDTSTRVSLDMGADDAEFGQGDMVRVTVTLERKGGVLWLPPQAIRLFDGRTFVVVQEGDGQRRVDVKVGIKGEDRSEIEDGLSEGLTVIGQ